MPNKMAEAAISLSEIQAIEISPVMGRAQKMQKNCIHIVPENIILRKIHSKRFGKRRGDGLKHTKLLHWINERSECQVSNRWLPRWHIQWCFKPPPILDPYIKKLGHQWDCHYRWDINGTVSRFSYSVETRGWQRAWRKLYQVRIMRRVWETLQSFCYQLYSMQWMNLIQSHSSMSDSCTFFVDHLVGCAFWPRINLYV